MIIPDCNLIFPPRLIPVLGNERGSAWQDLVKTVEGTGLDSPAQMAFTLMMARLCICTTCNADSFRSLHGCLMCATQALKRYHGSDKELLEMFETAKGEVAVFLQKKDQIPLP